MIRIRMICALLVAATVMWFMAPAALDMNDPSGPLSLMLSSNRMLRLLELGALAGVAAALASVVRGPGSSIVGPLAVAAGLAAAAYPRFGIEDLPFYLGAQVSPWPVRSLLFELWLWLGLIALGAPVMYWIESWSGPRDRIAGSEYSGPVDSAAEMRRGIGAAVTAAVLAFPLQRVLQGAANEGPYKSQSYFAVAASFCAAMIVAHWFFRAASPLWALLSVAATGSAVVVLGAPALTPNVMNREIHLLVPPLARALPLEYAAMGTVGVMIGFAFAHDWLERATAPRAVPST